MTAPQLIYTERVLRRADEILGRHPELRHAMASRDDLRSIRAHGDSSVACLAAACERYAERTCFTTATTAITYGQLWQRVTALAGGWVREHVVAPGDRVGICGSPGIDWVVADLACLVTGAVSVPLAVALPPDELRALVEHARLTTIACSAAQVPVVASALIGAQTCRTIVAWRDHADDAGAVASAPLRVVELAALEAIGGTCDPAPATGDPLITIMYTSGSTGVPKGVMLTERRWRAQLQTALGWPPFPHVTIGYLPHAQIAGRRLVLESMMHGGLTRFSTQALPFDDVRAVPPTLVPLVPRVSSVLYQQYQAELVKRGASHESAIIAEMRATALGDRLCLLRVGSGSTPPETVAFLQRCFAVPVADGYGTTETGSLTLNGTLFPHIAYKLVDVPELGYTRPRGELLVRSAENTTGYLDDSEATAALFDGDGYLRTGDIVEERAPRELVWIDRRTSVTKLAQGQFVATTRLEELYATGSPFLAQIYLYANPRHAFLLAVIVPDQAALRARGVTDDAGIRRVLREELVGVARATGRRSHEVPREFLVETEPFTVGNQLLTESGKPSQRHLRERYSARLDELHAVIEARQLAATHALADRSVAVPVRVRRILAIVLGLAIETIEAAPHDVGFVGFGGDSITALRFCAIVEEAFGVHLPVGSVLDPSAGVAAIMAHITHLLDHTAGDAIAYDTIHPDDEARAGEVAALVPSDTARGPAAARPPATVLLTGASGFLGRFLIFELAARLPPGGQVICLVRGDDDTAARERIRRALATGGGELAGRFDRLCHERRVAVHAGDLLQPRFGLAAAAHDALCDRLDAVVHSAALVNHAMSYRHLFETNVLGTREVVRIAARRPSVTINYVSSIAVATRPTAGPPIAETERASELWPTRPLGGASEPGVGYATSKWAGEIMIEELHRRHGTAANIFRSSNIAPHPDYPHHLNWADNTNRLLYSVLTTGVAPSSFYEVRGAAARYDLVPMDAVAATIAAVATGDARGLATYHISNAETQPALSLDTLLAWIESAGVPLHRLPHAAWFAACEERLDQLPAPRRARSARPTLTRWQAPIPADHTGPIETTEFRRTVRQALGREPAVDEALVHRWIRALAAE